MLASLAQAGYDGDVKKTGSSSSARKRSAASSSGGAKSSGTSIKSGAIKRESEDTGSAGVAAKTRGAQTSSKKGASKRNLKRDAGGRGRQRRNEGLRIQKRLLQRALSNAQGGEVAVAQIAKIVRDGGGREAATELRDALTAVLDMPAAGSASPDAELWGPEPVAAELRDAEESSHEHSVRGLSEFRDRAWTRERAAQHLAVTPQGISDRVKKGKLVGLRVAGRLYLPVWQFTEDGVAEGIDELVAEWPSTIVSLDRWAQARHPDLDATPAEVLHGPDGMAHVRQVLTADAVSRW